MAARRNSAEGQPNGTVLTAATSGGGSGNAFDAVTLTTSTDVKTDSAQSMHGTRSYRIITGAAATSILIFSGANDTSGAMEAYIRFNALPSAAQALMQMRNSAGNAAIFAITGTNKFQIQNAAGTGISGTTFATAISTGVWYRIEMECIPGTTTTNGTINGRYFLGDSGTVQDAAYSSGATVNAGTTNIDNFRFGKLTSATATQDAWWDDLGCNNGSSTPMGVPPSGTAYTFNQEPFDLVTLPAGTWTQTSGSPTVTLASNTFVAPATRAGTTLIFTSGSDTATVIVAPHSIFRIESGGTPSGVQLIRL